mgnify:CR=1 FL=1
MTDEIKKAINKAIQIYIENDYNYIVSLAKAGKELPESITDEEQVEFLKRNSIVPEDMPEEDIQKVASIVSKKINEINIRIYKRI